MKDTTTLALLLLGSTLVVGSILFFGTFYLLAVVGALIGKASIIYGLW